MKKLFQLFLIMVSCLFIAESSIAITDTLTGFRGTEFGKTVAYHESKGIKFVPANKYMTDKVKLRVDDTRWIDKVPIAEIIYNFDKDGELYWIEIEPLIFPLLAVDTFEKLKKILFLKYGETKLEKNSVPGMKWDEYAWNLKGGRVSLIFYPRDDSFRLDLYSQKQLDEQNKSVKKSEEQSQKTTQKVVQEVW